MNVLCERESKNLLLLPLTLPATCVQYRSIPPPPPRSYNNLSFFNFAHKEWGGGG